MVTLLVLLAIVLIVYDKNYNKEKSNLKVNYHYEGYELFKGDEVLKIDSYDEYDRRGIRDI